jgi:hypothetical protein
LHISFRTGGGRGEYEVVGNHSGYSSLSLEGWMFSMRWPDGIVRDTGLWLDPAQSGKPRLRSFLNPPIQVSRIIAPMLLLPDPSRAFRNTASAFSVLRAKQYTITEVGFGTESEFSGSAELVTFVPSFVRAANQAYVSDIGVDARWARIVAVYAKAALLPGGLPGLVHAHRDFMASGEMVSRNLTTVVTNIMADIKSLPSGNYTEGSDPLPALEALLGISLPSGPTLPPPDEIGEDASEVAVRSAHQYRLAKARGAAARRFSDQVRAAYNNRCAFCGLKLGGLQGIRSGIDAAHILAWSKHDLDVASNGIALCKLHHWAFDAGILMLRKEGDDYCLRFTMMADVLDPQTLANIASEGRKIPREWLPPDPAHCPSTEYLTRLTSDLGLTFKADISHEA